MAFKGYLIKNADNSEVLKGKWIERSTYLATPDQRVEIEAYRDDYTQDLERVTSPGLKSKIVFKTCPMDLAEKTKFITFFNNAMVDRLQRKVHLTYWNDDVNEYDTGYFYYPDRTWPVKDYTSDNILYDSLEIQLVEY